jgi:hypothetical protein
MEIGLAWLPEGLEVSCRLQISKKKEKWFKYRLPKSHHKLKMSGRPNTNCVVGNHYSGFDSGKKAALMETAKGVCDAVIVARDEYERWQISHIGVAYAWCTVLRRYAA